MPPFAVISTVPVDPGQRGSELEMEEISIPKKNVKLTMNNFKANAFGIHDENGARCKASIRISSIEGVDSGKNAETISLQKVISVYLIICYQ